MKYNNGVKLIQWPFSFKNVDPEKDYIGKIIIKPNEEYYWNYNDYFRISKFIKPYDALDWMVIGPSKNKNSCKLNEGDFIKLGKLVFLVRKIKTNQNENLNETKRNSSVDNSEMNLENNINEDIIIHKRINYENCNNINTNNDLLFENGSNKINNINITNNVNRKMKNLYLKLKNINKNQKKYRCRICFCEGNFEGLNPLISPCKCSGSVKYIHLNCLRKWLTCKIITKISATNDIYCYVFKSLKCEICQSIIPEIAEFRGNFLSLLDFKHIDVPYIILQSMYQYNSVNKSNSDLNIIFVISLKTNNQINIGRANNSNIRLSDVSVSRNHAKLRYSNGDFYLDDIGSKFGTLLLIQNNILFLPYKDINIQSGKHFLMFKLRRTCLGYLKCFKNRLYDKPSYLENFLNSEKKVYSKILDTFNYNIVDPIEKFSQISGSCSNSESFVRTVEDKQINEVNSEVSKINEEVKVDLKSNDNENKSNGLEKNQTSKKSNKENEENQDKFTFRESLPVIYIPINNSNKNNRYGGIDLHRKQNESREMLFNETKSNEINYINNKFNFSKIKAMNILNKNKINNRSISVFNDDNKINSNLMFSNPINKNKINDLANTERENKNKNINAEEPKNKK